MNVTVWCNFVIYIVELNKKCLNNNQYKEIAQKIYKEKMDGEK